MWWMLLISLLIGMIVGVGVYSFLIPAASCGWNWDVVKKKALPWECTAANT